MITLQEILLVVFATLYGVGGLSLLWYTDKLSKQIKQHEAEHAARREMRASQGDEDDLEPLLGVIYPPTHGYGRRHGKR